MKLTKAPKHAKAEHTPHTPKPEAGISRKGTPAHSGKEYGEVKNLNSAEDCGERMARIAEKSINADPCDPPVGRRMTNEDARMARWHTERIKDRGGK